MESRRPSHEGANLFVESFLRHRIICARILRNFARHGTAFGFPFIAPAIKDFNLFVTKQAKRPERVASPPVGLVTVKNTRRIRCYSVPAAKTRKFFRENIIAN